MAEFLIELGLEEIPARMLPGAEAEWLRRVGALLIREGLLESGAEAEDGQHSQNSPNSQALLAVGIRGFSTPRRLAVYAADVLLRQPDRTERLTGPSWKIAFQDGQPTAAALAFAKRAGVEPSSLEKVTTSKGDYVSAGVRRAGRTAAEILTEHLPKEIAALSWPKAMYWRAGKPERFVRPLRWLVCLLGAEVVPLEFAGIRAGNSSYGHRILHGSAPLPILTPGSYSQTIAKGFVEADMDDRRQRIRKSLDAAARSIPEARWREDKALVEQVTSLTEWPTVLAGGFEMAYLTLPEEILVTVMRDHQKYFALEDSKGNLIPYFLAVLNTQVDSQGMEIIRHGNERVLRARFNDARFFWDHDQKIPLVDREELLKSVTFQKDVGSYFIKSRKNLEAALALADAIRFAGRVVDEEALRQAVLLAKTDLTTELVKEFTELQGVVGGLYAKAQGLGETVAQAISTQYLPASADDPIPQTVEGQLLGLADRLSTVVEMFALGFAPSGSKDPFALRRAASGIIKILADSGLPLSLSRFEEIGLSGKASATLPPAISSFFADRLEFYLREGLGHTYDVVNAILAAGVTTVPDAVARAQALSGVRGTEDMMAIAAAFKRIKNILRQAAENKSDIEPEKNVHAGSVQVENLVEPAEQKLHAEMIALAPEVEALRSRQQYRVALERIAVLRPAVDAFFDSVMVMAPDPALRKNRLCLIASVLRSFSSIADFSEISFS